MTLSDISIKNPVFAWMLMAALMFFGLISYFRFGVSQLPNIDFPVVSISLNWENAAPEVMETDVVDIVEDAVMSVQGVNDVSTTISQGNAVLTIELELGKNIDAAVQEIQAKITQAQRLLPKDIDPPIITKVNPADQPIVWLAVNSSSATLRETMAYVNDILKDKFSSIEGVGDIFLGGYVDPNLRIWVDGQKLAKYQVTSDDIIDTVSSQHQEIPAGLLETTTKQYNIRVMGEAPSPGDFGNIIIERRTGMPVYKVLRLNDVASIENGVADIQRIAHTEGKRAVGLGIRKQRGANDVATAHRILQRLDEIRPAIPAEFNVSVVFNSTKFIEDSIHELTFTLLLSALVTSLVCWIFLGSWTATLNILLAIPTSILGSFVVIYFLGFTLNTFTVLGLTLAVGIVVDDAIMVLENIVRYRESGVEKVEAARVGARQITFAATAASLALIAIFLPVAFMKGITGKLFYQYGVTISVAVALSLLEALTLTPMRCSQFLKVGPRITFFGRFVDTGFKKFAGVYRRSLEWSLNHRGFIILSSIVFFIVSLLFVRILRKEFVPPQDMSVFACRIETPPGSSIEFTNEKFKQLEQFVMSRPDVKRYFGAIGGFGGTQANSGFMFVTLKQPLERPVVPPAKHRLSQGELMILFRREMNKIPDVRVFIQDLSLAGFSATRGFPVEFNVRGPDWNELASYSKKIYSEMKKDSLFTDVDTDYNEQVQEIHVYPDRKKAAARGVSVDVIGRTIGALIGGKPIGKYSENGKRYDIRIRLVPSQRNKIDDILNLGLWNNRGESVKLKDIVAIREEMTSLTITRRDRERAISLFSNVSPGKSQTDAIARVNAIANNILPHGYHVVFTGSAQTFKESFSSLFFVLLLGIIVSYMVLASQFNSYIHPVIVLLALPFSISGALISLWVGGQSINIYSFIGIILLMGIVKKNSILLVDFTNQYRMKNPSVRDALLEACPVRLRPILMTSLATIAAAIPPALALGPGAEIRVPMAAAVIGGVFFSTMLTLFVVPCTYSIFSRIERKKYDIKDT